MSNAPANARKLVHTESVRIRWGDMDAQVHVNNVEYFRYMEVARIAFFETIGVRPGGSGLPPGAQPVIINTACTFLRSLTFPGDVLVDVYLGEPGRTSVMTWYAMRTEHDPGTVYAEGSAKLCWVGREDRKAIPLPERIRSLLDQSPVPN